MQRVVWLQALQMTACTNEQTERHLGYMCAFLDLKKKWIGTKLVFATYQLIPLVPCRLAGVANPKGLPNWASKISSGLSTRLAGASTARPAPDGTISAFPLSLADPLAQPVPKAVLY